MEENSPAGYGDFIFSIIINLFLLEIVIGAFQVLGALIRTIICINTKQPIGKLKNYWIMVGGYFIVFFGFCFIECYVIRWELFNRNDEINNSLIILNYYNYFLCAHIVWIFLAWGIAIWYCIKIVFTKPKIT